MPDIQVGWWVVRKLGTLVEGSDHWWREHCIQKLNSEWLWVTGDSIKKPYIIFTIGIPGIFIYFCNILETFFSPWIYHPKAIHHHFHWNQWVNYHISITPIYFSKKKSEESLQSWIMSHFSQRTSHLLLSKIERNHNNL